MRQISIQLPRGCECRSVAIGSHEAAALVSTPAHMRRLGAVGCYTFRDHLSIDVCILPLVRSLWDRGVVTLGSCCGHNIVDGEIIVLQLQHDEWLAQLQRQRAGEEIPSGGGWRLTAHGFPYAADSARGGIER